MVAACPKKIWIELTSTCPFDCVFCSRKLERGLGQHMSFALYEALIRQLKRPEVIRLNYAGESLHYPRLEDAIRLARASGATVELVTALASATEPVLRSLVDAGLHRLSVSLHSLEEAQFRTIYGRGGVSDLRARLDYLRRYKAERGSRYPEIDFAFVAMLANLGQLPAVVEYAESLGVPHVSVHPVIRRGPAPLRFEAELAEDGDPRPEFAARVKKEAARAAARKGGVSVQIARPERPAPPAAGGITTCEQNPWETTHVLADGRVVVCEVQDRVEMGNLCRQTLEEIWTGERYREFRQRYSDGSHPGCARCPWRRTEAGTVLVRGWHPRHGESADWSEASAAVSVPAPAGAATMRVAGLLPPGRDGGNTLELRAGSGSALRVVNRTGELLAFREAMPLEAPAGRVVLRFETGERYCPAERGSGPDLRQLGFALTEVAAEYGGDRPRLVRLLVRLLRGVEGVAALPRRWRPHPPAEGRAPRARGISVVVPARDTPDLLGPTLAAAQTALARAGEPGELIVVCSGAPRHPELERRFERARWLVHPEALGYLAAVERGLARARYGWVYLLNSDMRLREEALAEVLAPRRWDTFAVGSRIRMEDGSGTETNWTDLRYCAGDAAELIERDPAGIREPRGCLYVGGGSGLFRASLLRRFVRRTRAYAPFYWEDVEWGARAWRYGYRCTFCPASEAVHGRRQTIARYYDEAEITRIFERNRLLFHLRNLSGIERLENRLLSLDQRSWAEILRPGVLLETAWARAAAFVAPREQSVLSERWKLGDATWAPGR